MNEVLRGETIVVAGHRLEVAESGQIQVDGSALRPDAGTLASGLASRLALGALDAADTPSGERGLGVDQTNVCVIVGERLIVKIVSTWAAADRSAELLARLVSPGNTDVPAVHKVVFWEHPVLGRSVLALVSEYVPDSTDGWTWAVEGALSVIDGGPDDAWPEELGALSARVHDLLAESAVPGAADVPVRRLRRARASLDGALATTGGPAGVRLANRGAALAAEIATLADTDPGWVFEIHGDFHVGQVLRTSAQRYLLLDFDGDPQLAASDRQAPDAAARDIAHFLVSIDLVAAVAQRRLGRGEPAAFAWADRARADFLDAYLRHLRRPEIFDRRLLPGLVAAQLADEFGYAARFLPRWAYAPDAVISHRYPSSDEQPEEPWTTQLFPQTWS